MHLENPNVVVPDNADMKVWRYTSLAKLTSLLHTSTLYFTRLDQSKDEYEGSLPLSWILGNFIAKLMDSTRMDMG